LNPLVSAAAPLLAVVSQIRNTMAHRDIAGLRTRLIDEMRAFEANARARGVSPEFALTARYVLCSLVDETVLSTPWGSESFWSKQGLLLTFHNETWGGEKFFLLLDKLAPDPSNNLHLLELMYICLALGFEGRYRLLQGGRAQLEDLRERLYRIIRTQRGDFERGLSPHWQGVQDRRNPLIRHVPLWVVAAVAALLLLALYVGLSFRLNRASDPLLPALHGIGAHTTVALNRPASPPRAEPTPPPKPQPSAPPRLNLTKFLAPEIREGLVYVREEPDRSTVIIRGDGLFASGRAEVKEGYYPLLARIAAALQTARGHVLVTGHTDNVPIFTPRFPSNWHLSKARAEAVVKLLVADTGTPQRFTAEGRADTEPLVPNDSAENRARNRRVEIVLLTAASSAQGAR
jgi:type VI secretion system protein ImpK